MRTRIAFILVVGLTACLAGNLADPALRASWSFETTDSAYDGSGNHYTGDITGATPIAGKAGAGMTFGADGDDINCGTAVMSSFTEATPWTVTFWLAPTDSSVTGAILCTQMTGATGKGIQIGISTSTSYKANIFVRVQGANRAQKVGTAVLRSSPVWTHVAASYNGNSDTSGIVVYINGVRDGVATATNDGVGDMTTTNPLYLGSRHGSEVPYGGGLDEVRVYNRILNISEVRSDMMGFRPGGS